MARGKKCACCGAAMFAEKEDDQPQGRWVTYACLSNACPRCKGKCSHRELIFESYAR